MQKRVLLYHIPEESLRRGIENALQALGFSTVYVDRRDYLKPVGTLAGAELFLKIDREYNGPEFGEGMLVMAGLNDREVDLALAALRGNGGGAVPYKAILTDTNQFWTSVMLYEELKKEREAFARRNNLDK